MSEHDSEILVSATVRMRTNDPETEMVLRKLSKYSNRTVVSSITEDDDQSNNTISYIMESDDDESDDGNSDVKTDNYLRPKSVTYKIKHEIDYGTYNINHHDRPIEIYYHCNGSPVGLMDCVEQLEILKLTSSSFKTYLENKTHLESFIISSVKNDRDKPKDKIRCFVAEEGFWKPLSKIPKRQVSSVFHPRRDEIIKDIKRFSTTELDYHNFGIPYKRNLLFYGPPGTGKTSMMTAIASEFDSDLYLINFSGRVTDASFMRMISKMPMGSILVLEDVDALFHERIANDSGNKSMVTFSAILNTLDGIARKNKMVTIMTTNYLDRLDSALIRPGRIDLVVEFKLASKEQIQEMFTTYFGNSDSVNTIFQEIMVDIGDQAISTAALQKFFFEFRDSPEKLLTNKKMLQDLTSQYAKTYHQMYS